MTFLFRRYKNIRKMDSTYIAEYGYNEPTSQPLSQPVSQSILDRKTDFSQPVSQSVLTFINGLFLSEDTKISEKLIRLISRSVDIMDQSASQSVSQSVYP